MKKYIHIVMLSLGLGLAALTLPAHAGIYEDMLVAIKTGSAPDVIALLNRGLDPNIVDREGYTLLMLAVRDGDADIVDVLLAAKANPNARNGHGDTALRLAAFRGSLPMVEKLVKARALINMPAGARLTDAQGLIAHSDRSASATGGTGRCAARGRPGGG